MTSASLQASDQFLNTACALYELLLGYIEAIGTTFSSIEQGAKDLVESYHYHHEFRRVQKRNRKYDDSIGSGITDANEESQTPSKI